MSFSSSDSDEEQLELLHAAAASTATLCDTLSVSNAKYRGRSLPVRAPNRDFNVTQRNVQLDMDYICFNSEGTPLYTESELERRYMIKRSVYERIRTDILGH